MDNGIQIREIVDSADSVDCTNCKNLNQVKYSGGICKIHNVQVSNENYCNQFDCYFEDIKERSFIDWLRLVKIKIT